MKAYATSIICLLFCLACQTRSANKENIQDPVRPTIIAEASCGECQFQLEGKGCDLAVRIDGKSYFVDGTKIDDHGDAHADDGFCNAIRKAEIQGTIVNNRFKATYFKLLDETQISGSAEKKSTD